MANAGDLRPSRPRRAFVLSCLGFLSAAASSVLGGCSFSLRDFLLSPSRITVDDAAASREDRSFSASSRKDVAASAVPESAQRGFLLDVDTCVGCASCVSACREASGTPQGEEGRRRLVRYELEGGELRHVPLSCLHCAEPACARVCPARAVFKRPDGVVVVDPGLCIGCRYCRQACPFDIPRYLDGVMDKCDFCSGAFRGPKAPRCASACPTGALRSGTLAELREVADGEVRLLDAPTNPSLLVSA